MKHVIFYHVLQYQPNPVTVYSRQQSNPYTAENQVSDRCESDGPLPNQTMLPSHNDDHNGQSD